jgi:flagellar protein FliO/FliZ
MDYSYLASFLKMLFALAVVLGVMLGALYLLKRIAGRNLAGGPESLIQILSTRHLGPKSSITMVDVAGRIIVLGVTANAINLLGEFEDEQITAMIRDRSRAPAGAGRVTLPTGRYREALASMLDLIKNKRNKGR